MKTIFVTVIALFAGFVGGVFGSRYSAGIEQSRTQHVIRARSFELVDQKGKTVSIWGMNKQGHTLLAFLGSDSTPGENDEHSVGLDDVTKLRASFGAGGAPSLTFTGDDGKTRMMLYLARGTNRYSGWATRTV